MIVISASFVLLGALLVGVSLALINRRVPQNGVLGLRTPATFASTEVWYAANEHSGRVGVVVGLVVILVALITPWIPGVGRLALALLCTATVTLLGVGVAVDGWRHAARLLADQHK